MLRAGAGRPLIIAGVVDDWGAKATWTIDQLSLRFGKSHVRVGIRPGGVPETMPLADFAAYIHRGADGDVEPRYVFEPRLRPPLTEEYDPTVGGLFPHDLLGLLGEDTRPPYRWLCLGPKRSGSRPHVDPLATSAWNALLSGRKRWAMIDPRFVDVALPRAEILAGCASPVEWFDETLPRLREKCPEAVLEAVQSPGEVMYVPAGVWHAVLNVTDTVAITHNFVGLAEFDRSWRAVSAERPGLAREWLRLLRERRPELARQAAASGCGDGALPAPHGLAAPVAASGWSAQLLQQRLDGARCLEAPRSAPTLNRATRRGPGGGLLASIPRRRGEVVFVETALACAYTDEASPGRGLAAEAPSHGLAAALLERLPKMSTTTELLSAWGLSGASSVDEVLSAVARHGDDVWCGGGGGAAPPGADRVDGRAVFPSSGTLRHAMEPSLVRILVCNVCVAVAARDIAEGDELSVCRANWRCDATAHQADLKANGAGSQECWPQALPPKDHAQTQAALKFLAQAERAAWSGDEASQGDAAAQLKRWAGELGGSVLLKSSPYLDLRAHMLLMHLCTGNHCLDDAWDAAVRVMDLALENLPWSEATELCVQLGLLGGALAYQQRQPDRARELFAAGAATCVARVFRSGVRASGLTGSQEQQAYGLVAKRRAWGPRGDSHYSHSVMTAAMNERESWGRIHV